MAHKAPLELPFLSILLLGGNFAKKSGASVCVGVCEEFVLYEEEEEEDKEEVCKRFGVDEVIVCKE